MPAIAENPNFVGTDEDRDVTTSDVLPEYFESGIVTQRLEEHYASEWEERNLRALRRTWETTRDAPYVKRKAHYDARRPKPPADNLSMDEEVAKEEVDRLLRSPNPEEHKDRINDLLVKVLHLEPMQFSKPEPLSEPPKDDETAETLKRKKFLDLSYQDQEKAVGEETDLEFIAWVLQQPSKRVMPIVKKTAEARAAELKKRTK